MKWIVMLVVSAFIGGNLAIAEGAESTSQTSTYHDKNTGADTTTTTNQKKAHKNGMKHKVKNTKKTTTNPDGSSNTENSTSESHGTD